MNKLLKSAVCFLLAISLLVPVFSAAGVRQDNSLSVFVASDIHYRPQSLLGPIGQQNGLPGDPLYAHVNTKAMLTYEADAVIDEFLKQFEQSSAKYLLIPGDLSENGYWGEHLGIAQKLREFKARTGKKIFIIPGNHDIRTSASDNRLNLSDFLSVYADIGYDETLARHEGSASYTAELDGGYRLIAIDDCAYREDAFRMSQNLHDWIKQQAQQAEKDGKKLIGMIHHSVLDHLGVQGAAGEMVMLDNWKTVASEFADWGIQYVFTGHIHANDISTAVSDKGSRIYDIETDSLITYPNGYREVNFSDTSVRIKTDYIQSIDTSLLPDGYNQAQLDLLENDFPAYSLGYFKAATKSYANEIPEATKKLAGLLKLKQGTKGYDALSSVLNIIGDSLSLPLYNSGNTAQVDSVEEIAALAGIKIAASDYDNFLELAGTIFSHHYAGDENLDYNSVEVKLFRQCLNAALVYSLTNIPVSAANTLFSGIGLPDMGFNIKNNIYTQTAKAVYMKTAAKTMMNGFIEPFAEVLTKDAYAPGDLNVTLEPYGSAGKAESNAVIISEQKSVWKILYKLLLAVLNAVKALFVQA